MIQPPAQTCLSFPIFIPVGDATTHAVLQAKRFTCVLIILNLAYLCPFYEQVWLSLLPRQIPDRPQTDPGQIPDRALTDPGQTPDLPASSPDCPWTDPGQIPDRPRTDPGQILGRPQTDPGQAPDRPRICLLLRLTAASLTRPLRPDHACCCSPSMLLPPSTRKGQFKT